MLVLSRKMGDTITIGDKITVSVIKLEGGRVRLGVEAPEDVRILRAELNKVLEVPSRRPKRSQQNA
jgi:carbon storage regulator